MVVDESTLLQRRVDDLLKGVVTSDDSLASFMDKYLADQLQLSREVTSVEVGEMHLVIIECYDAALATTLYHALRGVAHASPSFMGVLTVIWGVLQVVWEIIVTISQIIQVTEQLGLWEYLYKYSPAFREAMDQFNRWVSDTSEALGWGVDGLLHLIHATQGGLAVYSGLTNKPYEELVTARVERAEKVITKISETVHVIQDDPGAIIDLIAEEAQDSQSYEIFKWWDGVYSSITEKTSKIDKIISETNYTVKHVSQMLGYFDRYDIINIPDKLMKVTEDIYSFIDNNVIPALDKFESRLAVVDKTIVNLQATASSLAQKLAKPGDILEGVELLTGHAKLEQQYKIDKAVSGQMAIEADNAITVLLPDLSYFEKVDKALRAETTPPPFMTLENPASKALTGIKSEPLETWFVGDY